MRIVFLSSVDSYRRNEEIDLDPEIAHHYIRFNHAIEVSTKKPKPPQGNNKTPAGKPPTGGEQGKPGDDDKKEDA